MRPQDLGAYDYTMRAILHVWMLEKDGRSISWGRGHAIDPDYPLA